MEKERCADKGSSQLRIASKKAHEAGRAIVSLRS